jgi:hypothetical protein
MDWGHLHQDNLLCLSRANTVPAEELCTFANAQAGANSVQTPGVNGDMKIHHETRRL